MNQQQIKKLFINFCAEINQNTTEEFMAFISQKINKGVNFFYVMLSSVGGSVMSGITVYHFLRSLPVKIVMHNIGIVDSIANIIFLAADERYAVSNSSFLFHGVGFDIPQLTHFEEKDLKEKLICIERDQSLIAKIITDRTNLKIEEIKKMFYEAKTMTPDEAKNAKIIQEIKNVDIPTGSEIFSFYFPQRPWR